jgi:hypothetical protein
VTGELRPFSKFVRNSDISPHQQLSFEDDLDNLADSVFAWLLWVVEGPSLRSPFFIKAGVDGVGWIVYHLHMKYMYSGKEE